MTSLLDVLFDVSVPITSTVPVLLQLLHPTSGRMSIISELGCSVCLSVYDFAEMSGQASDMGYSWPMAAFVGEALA